jgi:hypothetical protein
MSTPEIEIELPDWVPCASYQKNITFIQFTFFNRDVISGYSELIGFGSNIYCLLAYPESVQIIYCPTI